MICLMKNAAKQHGIEKFQATMPHIVFFSANVYNTIAYLYFYIISGNVNRS